ncbi:class I SAM-dependent methyltransferase [Actinocorallia longicatena]|uniref:Class I SAM-dependent methyltransferase n=1 Tax=Actinocorallia longicatena TaxID=111803 RepID=A0ABP6QH47_9ACTN
MVREADFVKKNRSSLSHKISFAVKNPGKVPRYARRLARDTWLKWRTGDDHLAYYAAVMKSDTARNPEAAVGSQTHGRWVALGKMQFTYLKKHGLVPSQTMLEIGCGNLRAGRLFIEYLDTGNYSGIDISRDILKAARRTLAEYGIEAKRPSLSLVSDNRFSAFPDAAFDVIHAHSVYSHCPINVIEECFVHVGRILKPSGHFDFTFDRTEGEEHQVLNEDFYYRTETLVALAEKHGLKAEFMQDWEELKHNQSKIRITHPA